MHTTSAPRSSGVLLTSLVSCLVFLLAASASPSQASVRSRNTSDALGPTISTSCPAPGTARAAFMPSMTLGSHPTIVYVVNEFQTAGTLKRYDVLTSTKVEIVKMSHAQILSAQLSTNGQWLLFTSQLQAHGNPVKLQLVRMDGRYLQTLYCNQEINEVQWTTDGKLIAFAFFVKGSGIEDVMLLHTSNGLLQAELTVPPSRIFNGVILHTWLDQKRLYLTNTRLDQPPNIIYLLDTGKGPHQQVSDLIPVFNGAFTNFDSSFDAKKLYRNACSCPLGGNGGPGTITVQPATGGQGHTIYTSSNDAITTVRAVLPTTLLFVVNNSRRGQQVDNGLWKIKTDGTGVTRLTRGQANQSSEVNSYSQFPWSNVSRDGKQYVLLILTVNTPNITYTLEYSALKGGAPFVFASITNVQLATVGWTTM